MKRPFRRRFARTSSVFAGRGLRPDARPRISPMASLVGTMKHVSSPSRKIVIRHTMSRPCRACIASVS
eukprot:3160149-Prymnesium_polylepis.1